MFRLKKIGFFAGLLALILLSVFSVRIFASFAQRSSQEKPKATEALFEKGKALYQKQCAVCHGAQGRADGSAAYLLNPKPRNFAQDKFRLVSATTGATDEDLFKVITRGMPGSAMPPWGHLTREERWALAYYVRSLSEIEKGKQKTEMADLIQIPQEPAATPEALKRGEGLFKVSCAGCHGAQGKGDGQQKMVDTLGYATRPRDLTAGIFKGGSSSKELYLRMIGGMPGTPMPSYSGTFTQEQVWDLIHYVQTLSKEGASERVRLKFSQIKARKISGKIDPNPLGGEWQKGEPVFVALAPLWWRDNRIDGVEVQALHNGKEIAFYLKWNDATRDKDIVAVQSFSDAAALEFSEQKNPPFFGMGSGEAPVHLWHWKAAWEQVGNEREDVDTEYPHAAVDWYESQSTYPHGSAFEAAESKTRFHDPEFTTGWGAGNPVSNPLNMESAEEATAKGLGSYTTQLPKREKVKAKGVWEKGVWHLVFIRSLKSSEREGLDFRPGSAMRIAFALWDGFHKDRNGQKMVSIWNELILER